MWITQAQEGGVTYLSPANENQGDPNRPMRASVAVVRALDGKSER